MRLCEVKNIGKSYFHLWEQYSKPIAGGITIGSHPPGVVSYVVGIIEDSDGQVHRVLPDDIKFIKRKEK